MTNRTRTRLTNATTLTWPSQYHCVNITWNPDGSSNADDLGMIDHSSGSCYSKGVFEQISDCLVPGYGDKDCEHVTISFESGEGDTGTWATGGSGNGHLWYSWPNRDKQGTYNLLQSLNPWKVFTPSMDDAHTIIRAIYPPHSSDSIISGLYARAYTPRVDVLLNFAEANEIPNAIRTLAYHPSALRLARLWGSDRGPRPLQKANYLFRDIFSILCCSVKEQLTGAELRRVSRFVKAAKRASLIGQAQVIKLSRKTSSMYLAYQFGIAPLISDTRKLMRYMDRISDDYSRFRKEETRNCSSKISGLHTLGSSFPQVIDNSFGKQGQWVLQHKKAELRFHLAYIERSPYKTPFFKKLDFLMRRFTSGGMASFAWQRVPFSFVVDWFIDLGPILRGFDTTLGSSPIEVTSLTKTEECEAVYYYNYIVYSKQYYGDLYTSSSCAKARHYDARLYRRSSLPRVAVSTVNSDSFGKKRVALSSALAIQRFMPGSKPR